METTTGLRTAQCTVPGEPYPVTVLGLSRGADRADGNLRRESANKSAHRARTSPPQVLVYWIRLAFSLFLLFCVAVGYLFYRGVGIWGINIPVAWGFAIMNFVWWIGIGHAGTFISAILLLLHQKWRTTINRFTEAMTLFAVMCAGLFPLLHLGRPWVFFWLLPYPDTMALVAAISQSAGLGCFRGEHLFYRVVDVLVSRCDAGPGDRSRQGEDAMVKKSFTESGALGWRGSATSLAAPSVRVSAARRPGDAAGAVGA